MNTMQDRPSVVIGTMRCSGSFNGLMVLGRDTHDGREFVESAIARGFTTFDTSPVYARGKAEEDLGARLPHDAAVWTKAGVDTTTALPTLDYSVAGLARSLQGSLERLRRDHVEVAFVHNPEPKRVSDIDFAAFARHCSKTGQADLIGVSVLLPEVTLPQLVGRLPAGSLVMCEADQLDPEDTSTIRLLADYRLVVRSLFSGGSRLHAVPADRRAESIAARIAEIHEIYAPEAVVVGPRTGAQLADYEAGAVRWSSAGPPSPVGGLRAAP
ncbi:aldo/keto reductase family protein [Streptomyces sp. NPDC056683]|uniref:aldo/keto reductase family protein n=1 Tax=Streptomyces sp. NPDC056683 TaxID=3345910 RepID=UPI00369DA062